MNVERNQHAVSIFDEKRLLTKQSVDGFYSTYAIVNKKVMIYIPEKVEICNNVFITAQDNLGLRKTLNIEENPELIDKAPLAFLENPVDLKSLVSLKRIDFE